MKKRIVSALIVLFVFCTMLPTMAIGASKTSVDEGKVKILTGLGILEDTLPKRVTNDEYIKALMGFLYENDSKESISTKSFAKMSGMIANGEEYKPNSLISVDNALKYGVILLGYNEKIIQSGDYRRIASDKKLSKGVTDSINSNLSVSAMVDILYNLLDIEPLKMEFDMLPNIKYSEANGETLLSMYRNIKKYSGVVIADSNTSIYEEAGIGNGVIQIDNNVFYTSPAYNSNMLGCYTNAYVKDNDGDMTIIYIEADENKNDIFELNADDIVRVYDDYSKIEYEYTEGRTRTVKINKYPKVIYNGKFYGDYTTDDINIDEGTVTLVDNNRDGYYDIINILSYQTIVVDSINLEKKTIRNKLDFDGAITELTLEPNDGSVSYTIEKNDNNISFSEIKIGDVINVAISKSNDDKLCKITVCSDKYDFTVNSIDNEEEEIIVDDNTYKLSKDFIKQLKANNEELTPGSYYEFRLDSFGKIAFAKKMTDNRYVMFYKVFYEENSDGIIIRLMDIDGDWYDKKLAKRVKLNESGSYDAEEIYNNMHNMKPQVIKIRTNSSDEISCIETPTESDEYIENSFTKTPSKTYIYHPTVKAFDNIIYLEPSAKLFIIPESKSVNKDDYYVTDAASFFTETEFDVVAYDIDEYGYSSIISVNSASEAKRMADDLFVITGINEAVTLDGEIHMQLKGCGAGYKDISFPAKNDSIVKGLKVGDVVNFMLDKSGYINKIAGPITRLQDTFTLSNSGTGINYYARRNINAIVTEIDLEAKKIKLDYGSGKISFPIGSSINCMEYNTSTKKCDLITYDNICKGDKVMVKTNEYAIREIIRISE